MPPVAAVCRIGYYQLQQLRPLARRSFHVSSSILDYCNSLFYGITDGDGLMSRLQSVQNAAARLVSGARRYDRITPVLQELHWLPVRRPVDFKLACTLVYLSLSDMAPAYLAALTVSWSPTKVVVSSYADRCFAAAGPKLWNSFQAHLRQTDIDFELFKRLLKTIILFGC